jgi:hypothetical protein
MYGISAAGIAVKSPEERGLATDSPSAAQQKFVHITLIIVEYILLAIK